MCGLAQNDQTAGLLPFDDFAVQLGDISLHGSRTLFKSRHK